MPDFYNTDTFAHPAIGVNTATSMGTQLTVPGTNNTLPSTFVVLSASLPEDAAGFILSVSAGYGSGSPNCLVNLYVGASGQEQLLVGGIQIGRGSSTGGSFKNVYVPIAIPAGTRVTAKYQCDSASGAPNVYVSLTPLGAGFSFAPALTQWESWGADTTISRGKLVTASATTHTLGNKIELIASSTIDSQHIIVQSHQNVAQESLLTLYVGAAGSEVPILGPIMVAGKTDSAAAAELSKMLGTIFSLPLSIPAGSRISAAIQSNVASATADVSVLAFG